MSNREFLYVSGKVRVSLVILHDVCFAEKRREMEKLTATNGETMFGQIVRHRNKSSLNA